MEELNGLTEEEMKAIRSLKRLARKFPKSLLLFSWSGNLCVCKRHPDDEIDDDYPYDYRVITTISGITNDGGDPNLKYWDD
jgi:hypothetical protein